MVVALIGADIFIACKMANIAFDKGHEETMHIVVLCFLFTILGYLYVIALPDSTAYEQRDDIIQLLKSTQNTKNIESSLGEQVEATEEKSAEESQDIDNPIIAIPDNLLEVFKGMDSVQEMLDYVEKADSVDEEIIKIIENMASMERLYGNMKIDCIQKLSKR